MFVFYFLNSRESLYSHAKNAVLKYTKYLFWLFSQVLGVIGRRMSTGDKASPSLTIDRAAFLLLRVKKAFKKKKQQRKEKRWGFLHKFNHTVEFLDGCLTRKRDRPVYQENYFQDKRIMLKVTLFDKLFKRLMSVSIIQRIN